MKGCKVDTASKFEGHLGPRYIYTLYIYIYVYTMYVCTSYCMSVCNHPSKWVGMQHIIGIMTQIDNFSKYAQTILFYCTYLLNILYIYTHTFGVTFDLSRHLTPRQYFHRNRAGLHDPSIARVLRFICITVTSVTSLEKAILCSCALRMQRSVGFFMFFFQVKAAGSTWKEKSAPWPATRPIGRWWSFNENLIWFVVSGLDCEHVNLPPQEIWTLYNYLQDQRI